MTLYIKGGQVVCQTWPVNVLTLTVTVILANGRSLSYTTSGAERVVAKKRISVQIFASDFYC